MYKATRSLGSKARDLDPARTGLEPRENKPERRGVLCLVLVYSIS